MDTYLSNPSIRIFLPLVTQLISFLFLLLFSLLFLPEIYYEAGFRNNLIILLPEFFVNYFLVPIPFCLIAGVTKFPEENQILIERLKLLSVFIAALGLAVSWQRLGYLPILVKGDKELARQSFGIFGVNLFTSFWIFGLLLAFASIRSTKTNGKITMVILICFPLILLQRLYLGLGFFSAAIVFLFSYSKRKFLKIFFYLLIALASFGILLLIRTDGNLTHLSDNSSRGLFLTITEQFVIYYSTAFVNSVQYLSKFECQSLSSNGVGLLGPFFSLLFKHTSGWFDINFSPEHFASHLTHPAYNTWMRLMDYCIDTGGRASWLAAIWDGLLLSIYYLCAPPFVRRAVYSIFVVFLFFYPMGFYHLTLNFTVGYLSLCLIGWLILLRSASKHASL